MGEQSAVAQRAAFARRAARMLAVRAAVRRSAVQDAERQLAVAVARAAARRSAVQRAERLPAAQVHAERVQREAPHAVPALQGRGAPPALLLLLRRRPYAVARRLSSPLPRKR